MRNMYRNDADLDMTFLCHAHRSTQIFVERLDMERAAIIECKQQLQLYLQHQAWPTHLQPPGPRGVWRSVAGARLQASCASKFQIRSKRK
jgi:hypothetical protein